jgi:cysteine desulfurase / selenocysteine lyase
VSLEGSGYAAAPARFEPGTPNVAAAAGLTRAIEFVRGLGLDAIERHERELTAYARTALEAQPGVRLLGPRDSLGVVSFVLDGVHPHDAATILDRHGIAVRAGHHCAQPLMDRLGLNGTVRASFAVYNTRADVDALIGALGHAREVLAS